MDDDCQTLFDVISDADALDSFLNVDGLEELPSHSKETTKVQSSKNILSQAFVAAYIDEEIPEADDSKANNITDVENVMLTNENATGLITATFDPGGQLVDKQQGKPYAENMDDSSIMISSSQDQNSVSMDDQLKDIFGDDDLFSDTTPIEPSSNPFDSLLSQAAAEAGVFPFMDDMDEPMESAPAQPVEIQQPIVTNQLVIPAGQPVVSMQQQVGTMPQKVNTMPVFNQTLQPMVTNQSGQTAVLQVTPSGQQIIQQVPTNNQGSQQILIQGLMPQLAPVKTSQGIIGTVQLQPNVQRQQQLTSFVLNTGGTRIPIQTVVNTPMQQKLSKVAGKSAPVAISPKPISKGPRHISPKPQPGQRVIQILPNQTFPRTLQLAPRAPGQPQTFLIRNPNMPGNLQLIQGLPPGQTVIANSSMVRAPNYQLVQTNSPTTNIIQGKPTTQTGSTSTQSNTNSKRKKNSQSNMQTTPSKAVAQSSSSSLSTSLSNQLQGNFVPNSLNYNLCQPVNSQRTVMTVTETDNKPPNPVITIGASGSMIVVKQAKPIVVTAKDSEQTTQTSISNQKSILMPHQISQNTVLFNQQHIMLPSTSGSQLQPAASLDATEISFNTNNSATYQVASAQQLPGQNLTKQSNIPAYANPILSQSVSQTVHNSSSLTNTASNLAQSQYSVQQSLGEQNTGVFNKIFAQQVSTPNISLTHRQVQIQSDNSNNSSYSVGLPPPQQSNPSQPLQVLPSVDQNKTGTLQAQTDQQQKLKDLQVTLQRNPNILKELMRKHPTVLQNSFKMDPQTQQKLQTLIQQAQQSDITTGTAQNVTSNQVTDQQIAPPFVQSNTPSQGLQTNQQIEAPNTNVQHSLLNANSDSSSSVQPIVGQSPPVISAQAAAIMKYPPSKRGQKNAKTTSKQSVSTATSSNPESNAKQDTQSSSVLTPTVPAPANNQGLPQTFQISIKAQEQLQTIQNHIRTLTGMPNLTEQQSRLLQQLKLIQQKIVLQARQQMLAQQTRQPIKPAIQPQPTSGGKSNKKAAAKNSASKQNSTSTGKEPLVLKQDPTSNVGIKTGNLTPSQLQIVRSFQEKLKTMNPEEQQAYIKSQQSLLLTLQQQKQANQGQSSTGTQLVKIESKGTKRPAQYQLTRSSLMLHQIKQNQEKIAAPDLKTPFKNYKDAIHRLLDYHVSTDHTPTSEQLEEIDEAFEEVSINILEKKQKMYSKYQHLIMQDSMKLSESSEMVMLGRILLQDEKNYFEEEKQMPQDELIAKLQTIPGLKLIKDDDLKLESIESDTNSGLMSPVKFNQSEIQDDAEVNLSPVKLEIKSEAVEEILKSKTVSSNRAVDDIVSPPLDHRTKGEPADILELDSKDCNGFITRDLAVEDDGRQKPLKLKIKLHRPSTLEDLLGEQEVGDGNDSDVDESVPPTPTFDSSLNGEAHQNSNSYDDCDISDFEEDLTVVSTVNKHLEIPNENMHDESMDSELNEEDSAVNELRDDDFDTSGALNVQNQSAINHILSFRNSENVEISKSQDNDSMRDDPSIHDDHSDIYESKHDGMVNGMEFDFDDDEETMNNFRETEQAINKLGQDLEDFGNRNIVYDCAVNRMQDPDLEEAVNSILL